MLLLKGGSRGCSREDSSGEVALYGIELTSIFIVEKKNLIKSKDFCLWAFKQKFENFLC